MAYELAAAAPEAELAVVNAELAYDAEELAVANDELAYELADAAPVAELAAPNAELA